MSKGAFSVISRYESKYLITADQALAIRDFIRPVCSPDHHAGPDGRYTVNNLYFETPDLRFYHDTKFKKFTRFKPRVRFYDDHPKTLWLELKHKVKNITWKVRRKISTDEWATLFNGVAVNSGKCERISLRDSFEDAVIRYNAAPILQVRYVREPFVSEIDEYGRITFDRALSFRPVHGSFDLHPDRPFQFYDDPITEIHEYDDSPVLLEIKTESFVPIWVQNLIRRFSLGQRGFSKYCYAVDNAILARSGGDRVSAFSDPAMRVV
jgi:hypothetical protein